MGENWDPSHVSGSIDDCVDKFHEDGKFILTKPIQDLLPPDIYQVLDELRWNHRDNQKEFQRQLDMMKRNELVVVRHILKEDNEIEERKLIAQEHAPPYEPEDVEMPDDEDLEEMREPSRVIRKREKEFYELTESIKSPKERRNDANQWIKETGNLLSYT